MYGLPSTSAAQLPALYQPREMRADLELFENALNLAHPALGLQIPAEELERLFARATEEARTPLSSVDFHLLVMRLVAGLHDGHTRAFVADPTRGYINRQGLLPFHVMIRDERIFILRDLSDADLGEGSEILAINGIQSNAILRRLGDYIGVDGSSRSGLAYRLGSHYNSFYRVFPLVSRFPATYEIALHDARSGTIRDVTLAPIGAGDFQRIDRERYGGALHLQSLEEELTHPPLELKLNRDAGYAVLRVRRFFKDGFDEPAEVYPALYREVFRSIDRSGITGLIVDLRGNGGGIGANAAHLLQYLSDSTFSPTLRIFFRGDDDYYRSVTKDDLELDDYFGLVRMGDRYVVTRSETITELRSFAPVEEYRFRGRLVVLVDGGTVSAAGMAAGLLQQYTRAVFVGQEAGGYAGMSNGLRQLTVRGTHTDSGINFPLAHSEFAVNRHRRGRGVVPDYTVADSVDDIIAGRDAALRFAVELLK